MECTKIEVRISEVNLNSVVKNISICKIENYKATSKMFEELIEKGIAKKRGFNLMGINDKRIDNIIEDKKEVYNIIRI